MSFNLSDVFGTVARTIPDHAFLVWRDKRLSYADVDARVDGFAHYLASVGLGCHTERLARRPRIGAAIRDRLPALEVLIQVGDEELVEVCQKSIARYKIPKAFIRTPTVVRSPAGKADYRWAKELAVGGARSE
jgi:acyl-CoA synthetase (AMP-forming)/AMP-acid ligase II